MTLSFLFGYELFNYGKKLQYLYRYILYHVANETYMQNFITAFCYIRYVSNMSRVIITPSHSNSCRRNVSYIIVYIEYTSQYQELIKENVKNESHIMMIIWLFRQHIKHLNMMMYVFRENKILNAVQNHKPYS